MSRGFFGSSYKTYMRAQYEKNKILHGDQTRYQENFYRATRTLTRDLFAVAKLLGYYISINLLYSLRTISFLQQPASGFSIERREFY